MYYIDLSSCHFFSRLCFSVTANLFSDWCHPPTQTSDCWLFDLVVSELVDEFSTPTHHVELLTVLFCCQFTDVRQFLLRALSPLVALTWRPEYLVVALAHSVLVILPSHSIEKCPSKKLLVFEFDVYCKSKKITQIAFRFHNNTLIAD